LLGAPITAARLDIVLPVGISFYTFQTLSYTIDVYRGQLPACATPSPSARSSPSSRSSWPGPSNAPPTCCRNSPRCACFDRAKAADGLRQMLWGLFKKMVVADNCAAEVERIFGTHEALGGSTLLLGAAALRLPDLRRLQRLQRHRHRLRAALRLDLMRNFAFPYFSRDMAEFWRRWHISLSTWFRDYLYIPLGGSKGGRWMAVRNTFVIFLVSGFWHGANWTFLIWGAINAVYFLPLLLRGSNRRHLEIVAIGRFFPSAVDAARIAGTFLLTCMAWVFFRATDLPQAWSYLSGMLAPSLFSVPAITMPSLPWLLAFFVSMEWLGREHQFALERMGLRWPWPLRWGLYAVLVALIGAFMAVDEVPFIYFQF
jgi:alginate O-acetyltransferase complex protein AlgI